MARPTEYSPEIIEKTQAYLEQCQDEYDEFHRTRGSKSDSYDRLVKVNIPTIEGLALYLGINRATLYRWEQDHTEFCDIMDDLRAKQAEMLIKNGLSGDYNPTIAKVLLTKHGYREGTELTGKEGENLQLGVVILPKKNDASPEGTLGTTA